MENLEISSRRTLRASSFIPIQIDKRETGESVGPKQQAQQHNKHSNTATQQHSFQNASIMPSGWKKNACRDEVPNRKMRRGGVARLRKNGFARDSGIFAELDEKNEFGSELKWRDCSQLAEAERRRHMCAERRRHVCYEGRRAGNRHTKAARRDGVICLEDDMLRRLGNIYGEIRDLKRQLSARPQLTAVSWTPDGEPVQESLEETSALVPDKEAVRPKLTARERRKLTVIKQQESMMAGVPSLEELRPSIEFGVTQPPAVGQRVDVALSSADTSCWLAATVRFVGILRNSRALGLTLPYVGLELDQPSASATAGAFLGMQYFPLLPGMYMFIPQNSWRRLRPRYEEGDELPAACSTPRAIRALLDLDLSLDSEDTTTPKAAAAADSGETETVEKAYARFHPRMKQVKDREGKSVALRNRARHLMVDVVNSPPEKRSALETELAELRAQIRTLGEFVV